MIYDLFGWEAAVERNAWLAADEHTPRGRGCVCHGTAVICTFILVGCCVFIFIIFSS